MEIARKRMKKNKQKEKKRKETRVVRGWQNSGILLILAVAPRVYMLVMYEMSSVG